MDRRRRSDKYILRRRCWAAKKAAALASVGEGAAVELGSGVKTGAAVGACEAASVAGTSVAGILGAGVSAEPGVPETFGLGAEEPPMSTMLPLPLPDGPHAVRKTVAANSRVPIIFFKYFIIINAEAKFLYHY